MKPLITSAQLRKWEAFTIQFQKISSFELMERAARAFTNLFIQKYPRKTRPILFLTGQGNNGGDGLAIARMLHISGYKHIYMYESISQKSINSKSDRSKNRGLLSILQGISWVQTTLELKSVLQIENLHVIDAVFGIGFNRTLPDEWQTIFTAIHDLQLNVTAVDIPSGLPADEVSVHFPEYQGLRARDTFTFQIYKPCMIYPESGQYCGQIEILDIGLAQEYVQEDNSGIKFVDSGIFNNIKPLQPFSHKGMSGKVFQFCGSNEMPGACILSSGAALRAGAGYVHILSTEKTINLVLGLYPEVIVNYHNAEEEVLSDNINDKIKKADSLLLGPGLGRAPKIKKAILDIMEMKLDCPLVLDADALNILAECLDNIKQWPGLKVLTPHALEFDRLFGQSATWSQREIVMRQFSKDLDAVILLKGAFTRIAFPDGSMYINTSGNSGLATAGSGDVLSGILSAFLAHNLDNKISILSAVYLHGRLADDLAINFSKRSILPSDLIRQMGKTLNILESYA